MEIRKRIRVRLIVLALEAAAILALALVSSNIRSRAEDTQKVQEQDKSSAEAEEKEQVTTTVQPSQDKEETVYVKADAEGNVRDITVEAVLKGTDESGTIRDISNLSDIRNTKGDEEYTKGYGGSLIWENHGEAIHYKGKSSEELPLTVCISYFLDGKKVSPEQLAGKSGKLRIRFDYENRTQGTEEAPVPFLVMSALLLPEDVFTNVAIINGKLISMDGQSMAVGMAYPGIASYLELSDYEPTEEVEIPEYVEITADVTDFELAFTATIVTTGSLEELDTEDLDEVEEFIDSMSELTDASGELADGTGELLDGINEFGGYLKEYVEGARSLKEGAKALKEGTEQLDANKAALQQGAESLQTGLEALDTQLQSYLQSLSVSSEGLSEEMLEEVSQIEQTLTALQSGVHQLAAGSAQLTAGISAFNTGIGQLNQGTAALYDGARELASAGEELSDGFGEVTDGVEALKDGMEEFDREGVQKLGKLAGTELGTIVTRLRKLKEADGSYQNFSGIGEGQTGSVKFIIETDEI